MYVVTHINHGGEIHEVDESQYLKFVEIRHSLESACFYYNVTVPEIQYGKSDEVKKDIIKISPIHKQELEVFVRAMELFVEYVFVSGQGNEKLKNLVLDALLSFQGVTEEEDAETQEKEDSDKDEENRNN
jgi:hypothetical protein